jgi:hypothetical protein
MRTSNESKKQNRSSIYNALDSNGDVQEDQNLFTNHNKYSSTLIDDKILDRLNIEDLKSLLKIEMAKTMVKLNIM